MNGHKTTPTITFGQANSSRSVAQYYSESPKYQLEKISNVSTWVY